MVLAREEAEATDDVFTTTETNAHFKSVGRALGLVRIKDIHLGKIEDLKQTLKETQEPIN